MNCDGPLPAFPANQIHGGQFVRRDCGRFVSFLRWYSVAREEDPDFSAGAPGAEAESISVPKWLTTAETAFVR